jgi:hypothetical protein
LAVAIARWRVVVVRLPVLEVPFDGRAPEFQAEEVRRRRAGDDPTPLDVEVVRELAQRGVGVRQDMPLVDYEALPANLKERRDAGMAGADARAREDA